METEGQTSNHTQHNSHINGQVKITWLFEPDVLLPAQYFGNICTKTLEEPEKSLMLAVLDDAINCFQDNIMAQSRRRKRLFKDAEEWILKDDGDWVFSFENICEALGFDPEYVRRGLLQWKEKKRAVAPTPNHRSSTLIELT